MIERYAHTRCSILLLHIYLKISIHILVGRAIIVHQDESRCTTQMIQFFVWGICRFFQTFCLTNGQKILSSCTVSLSLSDQQYTMHNKAIKNM